jgi:hypothetical protein
MTYIYGEINYFGTIRNWGAMLFQIRALVGFGKNGLTVKNLKFFETMYRPLQYMGNFFSY